MTVPIWADNIPSPGTMLIHVVKVVDEMSAILHLPNETAIPLEADHQTMCKFLTSSNPNYIVVRDCIDEIIETLARVSGSSCTS